MHRNTREFAVETFDMNHRRGVSTKTVLIILAVVFGLMFLACAGAGVAVYFVVKNSIENIQITDPAKIRTLTQEMVSIDLPVEFVPVQGSSLFGFTQVNYGWCPSGSCPGSDSLALTLSSMGEQLGADSIYESDSDLEELLRSKFANFTKDEHEFEIRGRKCKFLVAKGDLRIENGEEITEELGDLAKPVQDQPTSTSVVTDPAADVPAEPTPASPASQDAVPTVEKSPSTPAPVGPNIYWVHGQFPSKKGICTLELHLAPEHFDEEKILKMLRSIR